MGKAPPGPSQLNSRPLINLLTDEPMDEVRRETRATFRYLGSRLVDGNPPPIHPEEPRAPRQPNAPPKGSR